MGLSALRITGRQQFVGEVQIARLYRQSAALSCDSLFLEQVPDFS